MASKELPKEYKGYSTGELLQLWEDIKTPQGIKKGTPKDKISAMRGFLREYKVAPIYQDQ